MAKRRRDTVPPVYKREFQTRLAGMRKAIGMSQAEFAAALGLEAPTYAKYESRSLPPMHLLPKICELTGHGAWYLLTGQPDSRGPRRVVAGR